MQTHVAYLPWYPLACPAVLDFSWKDCPYSFPLLNLLKESLPMKWQQLMVWLLGLSVGAGGAATEKKSAQALASEEWIDFNYQIEIPALKAEQLPLQIAVPLAPSNAHQSILARTIKSSDHQVLEQA